MQCSHHPSCPGCPLLDLDYSDQLARKQRRLQHALGWFPQLPEAPDVIGSAHTEGYRHRLKLPVVQERGQLCIGLTDPSSGKVLDTPDCPVLTPALREVLGAVRTWLLGRKGVHSIDLRISEATGEAQLVLACAGGELHGGKRAARELVRQIPTLTSFAVSTADPKGKRVMGRRPQVIAGRKMIEERVGETTYHLTPGAFFQIDPRQAEVLHELVDDWVGPARSVLDLYAGVGAYGRRLARRVERVVAVEEVSQTARAATIDAPDNLEVIRARVEDAKLGGDFDVAVLNPARRGADPALLRWLAKAVPRVVYVSCGPETLARDLDACTAFGLHPVRMQAIDLFPQTREVETVVLLERGKPRVRWQGPVGETQGPWHGRTSGALGRPRQVLALVLGDVGDGGQLPFARFKRLAKVAGHSLVRIELERGASPGKVLATLARRGHPTAGRDERTRRFFADKAGLLRPFVHVERAGDNVAPMHGDLALALLALGARVKQVRRLAGW